MKPPYSTACSNRHLPLLSRFQVLALLILWALGASALATPMRVMTLGDSITAADPGYRGFLNRLLVQNGYEVEFVGSVKSTNAVDGLTFRHEGHGGFTIGPGPSYLDKFVGAGKGNLDANLEKWLQADPHIILLLIGVNEYFNIRGMQNINPDVDGPIRLAALVDRILSLKPEAHLLVGNLLPVKYKKDFALAFNTAMPGLLGKEERVTLVDLRGKTEFSDEDWLPDGTHPSPAGHEKIAKVWYEALRPHLKSSKTAGATSADPADKLACSPEFGVYARDPSAKTLSVDEIYARTLGKAELTQAQAMARKAVIAMYRDAGIDVSLDNEQSWTSKVLLEKMPKTWSTRTPQPLGGEFKGVYSIDAAWNLKIPRGHPRVALPENYFNTLQLCSPNSPAMPGGDGIGMGVVVANPGDPVRTLVKAWSKMPTQTVYELRISDRANDFASLNPRSDRHLIFIDPVDLSCVCALKIRLPGDPLGVVATQEENYQAAGLREGYYARALAAGLKHRLDGICSEGPTGSVAAGFSQLGLLLRTGEVTDKVHPIRHALGGTSAWLMKARVYPASAWDSWISTCAANVGAIPYGALVQLDPTLDLKALLDSGKLSFPAFRILEAIQTYGWYMTDSSDGGSGKGVTFMIYAANPASEYAETHPPSVAESGVQAVGKELSKFIIGDAFFGPRAKFYVVAPLVKFE